MMLIPTDIYKSIPSGSTSKAVNKSAIKYPRTIDLAIHMATAGQKNISIFDALITFHWIPILNQMELLRNRFTKTSPKSFWENRS